MTRALTERRKADRKQMADAVCDLLTELGIAFERHNEGRSTIAPRETMINIDGPRGLGLYLDFDGDRPQPDTHVLAWCIRDTDARLAGKFESGEGIGTINEFHRRKLTAIVYGFDALMIHLREKLTMALDGSAFEAEAAE